MTEVTTPILTERFDRALTYAHDTHRADLRKGTAIPYVSHLMAVAALVLEHGGNEHEAIAALLHDAAEDHGGEDRLRDIETKFGTAVRNIVEGCSDSLVEDRTQKEEWGVRKRRYLSHLANASSSVRLVSCADKLHNARATVADLRRDGVTTWSRFNAGQEHQLWYYRSLRDLFLREGPAGLAEELARAVREMEELSR